MSKTYARVLVICCLAAFVGVLEAQPLNSAMPSDRLIAAPNPDGQCPGQGPQREPAGHRIDDRIEVLSAKRQANKAMWIQVPGASFVKVHFSAFNLPPGAAVEVSNPDGSESYSYSTDRMGPRTRDPQFGDDGYSSFSAMSITGDTAVVRVLGARDKLRPVKHRVEIDYYMAGYPAGSGGSSDAVTVSSLTALGDAPRDKIETQCGSNERVDAACFETSYTSQYEAARAVGRILLNGNFYCTAWRVGPGNHLFTNEHCVADQAELSSAEVWFDYEHDSCGGQDLRPVTKVTGAELIDVNAGLDYALFSVNDFDSIEGFGYLGLEVDEAIQGELIYIPQHGGGLPKQIALMSDLNFSGQCEIDEVEDSATAGNTDIGYYCDTRGGSSGSPVVLTDSNRVIGLHHVGGCPNSGVKMSLIWPEVATFFGGVIPGGDPGNPLPDPGENQLPQPAMTHSCSELLCTFSAEASTDPDGEITAYSWDFGDASGGTGAVVSHQFSADGNYTVTLTVADNDGATAEATELLSVSEANQAPSAAYSVSCNDLSCSFNGGLSADADGEVVNYAWSFGDGAASSSASSLANHQFAQAGSYQVTLEVTDNDGAKGLAQSTVTVTEPVVNAEPVAAYSVSCIDLSCTFDASGSSDPDGSVVAYTWNFGESESTEAGGPVKSYVYSQQGEYWVTLQVEDDQGAVSAYSAQVNVTAAVVEPEPDPEPAAIQLFAEGNKYRGSKWADLKWSGATSAWVDVYRDGALLLKIPNSGAYQDASVENKTKSAVYQVCESGTASCSEAVTALF